MKTSLRLYVYTINAIGLCLIAYVLSDLPNGSVLDKLIFISLAVAVQLMPVALSKQSTMSVSWSISYASILLYGPEAGVLTCMAVGLIASYYPNRLRPYKILFNTAGNAITGYLCGELLLASAGWPAHWLFEFLLAPMLYYASNSLIVTYAIALATGIKARKIWNENYRWLSLNYLLLATIGIGLANAYQLLHFLGLLIFIVPLVMARYSFKLYVDQTKKVQIHVESVEKTNQLLNRRISELAALQKHAMRMGGSLDGESSLRALLTRVSDDVPYEPLFIVWRAADGSYERYWMEQGEIRTEWQAMHSFCDNLAACFQTGRRVVSAPAMETHATLLNPMIVQGDVFGVMALRCPQDQLEELDSSLDVYVAQAAVAFSNARLFQQMELMANTDNLTRLYNRHYLQQKVRELQQEPGMPVTVVVMDFDNFKEINNQHGHLIGDRALHYVASLIRDEARDGDIPVRFGGDEFAMVLPNATEESGLIVAMRLLERIRQPFETEGLRIFLGLSIGVASSGTCGNMQETVKHADKAAYVSKARGKGRLTLYSQICREERQAAACEMIVTQPEESETRRSITKGLLHALKARDVITYHHSEQVATYSVWLAQHLGLTSTEIERIRLGALLHDIGKLGISDAVLYKTSLLTDEEQASMRSHPVLGHQVLQHFGSVYESIMPIVLSHHERIDGLGYPQGMRDEQIDLATRIIAIADAFDAMIEDSCYRDKLPFTWAALELRRCAGTQFDAQLTETFITVLKLHFPERFHEDIENQNVETAPIREVTLQ